MITYATILGGALLGGVYLGTRIVYGAWRAATNAHPSNVWDCPWWVVAGSFGLGIAVLLFFSWALGKVRLAEKLCKLLG